MSDALLCTEDLTVHFHDKHGPPVRAVEQVNIHVKRGETLGIVGESGSGKSTLAKACLQLLRPTSGKVWFDGEELTSHWRKSWGRWRWDSTLRNVRQHMQVVFQDPYASLDPRMTVEDIIIEPLVAFGRHSRQHLRKRAQELMEQVGLDSKFLLRYPHQFSGGQRQRIGIARALALSPKLIVCDEPLSALDVSIQAQIMQLLLQLQRDLNLTYVFVAHDLASVRLMSNHVAVMYLGRVVELGRAKDVFDAPMHPYTQALIASSKPRARHGEKPPMLPGEVPSPRNPPSGCVFHPRCAKRQAGCDAHRPSLDIIEGTDHHSACPVLLHTHHSQMPAKRAM